jgi:cell division protein FtsI/penicillin-binding protein 2
VLTLDLAPGARRVLLSVAPLDMAALARPGDQQYRHLRVDGGRLAWQALPGVAAGARAHAPVPVTLTDRNGAMLWSGSGPTPAAMAAGLGTLLGVRAEHVSGVAGMLARTPSATGAPHSARLAIDLALQAASQRALDCIGLKHGRLDGARCEGTRAPPNGRQAGIVVVDADNGDVLAAAGAGLPAVDAANWAEVRDFDRSNPARSPLRLPALQHDGGAHRSPGSTFKVISALGLEQAAKGDPQVEALLAGLPLPALNRIASDRGFAFQTAAATYPVGARAAHITNYKDQQLDRRAQDGRLGLSQALAYSLNTWFAWTGELSDRSLFGRPEGGAADLQALEPGALDTVRPIVGMARRLGFEQALRLDGGLLPADFDWGEWDALQASAARIDPIHSRHELRQMAIGLRMQATPLQMALVAGAVGQGRTIVPRLLLELDGRQAEAPAGAALGVRLDRVRAGMKGVVDSGTAAGAFRSHEALRRGLSGKTGTSPSVALGEDGKPLSTVWFTGWLEPGTLPNQPHRLAVAVFVSHSETTGGEHAAPIAAAVLEAVQGANPGNRGVKP